MFGLLGLIQLNIETHGAVGLRNPKKSLTGITSDLCPKSRPHPHCERGMFPLHNKVIFPLTLRWLVRRD